MTIIPERPEPIERNRRVPPTPVLIAVACVLVLLAAGSLVVGRFSKEAPGEARPTPSPQTQAEQVLLQTVGELRTFVERERGLEFKQEVDVTLLSAEKFRSRLIENETEELDKKEAEESEEIFKALKLVKSDVDLTAEAEELAGESILGFYDPETDELVVRGEELTPFRRVVLVHEITHALQDQHFNLFRPELLERSDESSLGFDAVVEGDANRIERKYFDTLPPEERRSAQLEEEELAGVPPPNVPEVLFELFSFPYSVGPPFVDALIESGGQTKLDDAFRTPPATSEVVLHPERYLAGEAHHEVAPPPAEGEVIDEGVFGEFALLLLLSEAQLPFNFGPAAEGWGGDYYVAYRRSAGVCLRVDFVMDSPRDQSELRDSLRSWADYHGSATVSGGTPTRLTACS